jgi:hypothetical protein
MAEQVVKVEEQHSLNPTIQEQHKELVDNKARTKGWRPLEEWHGEPEDWVDSREFLGREPLFDRIQDLKNQLHQNSQKFDKEFQVMANHFAQMRDIEYKRALAELKGQIAIAKDEKDVDTVETLTTQLAAVEQERKITTQATQAATQPTSNADPEKFRQWKIKNEWFDKDTELQDEAMSMGIGYSARHPTKSQDEVYAYVEKRIKQIYPEKFQSMDNQDEGETKQVASAVEGGSTGKKPLGAKKGKLSVGDLDEREKEVMKTFIKRGVLTQEKYLEDLAKARGL